MNRYPEHTASLFDLDANVVVLITWLSPFILSFIPLVKYVAFLAPLVILYLEKNSDLVRQHAGQAGALQLCYLIINIIQGTLLGGLTIASLFAIPFNHVNIIGGGLAIILILIAIIFALFTLAFFIFSVIAMVKGYHWEEYTLPVIGAFGTWLTKTIKN